MSTHRQIENPIFEAEIKRSCSEELILLDDTTLIDEDSLHATMKQTPPGTAFLDEPEDGTEADQQLQTELELYINSSEISSTRIGRHTSRQSTDNACVSTTAPSVHTDRIPGSTTVSQIAQTDDQACETEVFLSTGGILPAVIVKGPHDVPTSREPEIVQRASQVKDSSSCPSASTGHSTASSDDNELIRVSHEETVSDFGGRLPALPPLSNASVVRPIDSGISNEDRPSRGSQHTTSAKPVCPTQPDAPRKRGIQCSTTDRIVLIMIVIVIFVVKIISSISSRAVKAW